MPRRSARLQAASVRSDATNNPYSHANIIQKAAKAQLQSPLFCKLSPELRYMIFSYTLADYPDESKDKQYGAQTIYSRPSYFSPRRSDTALLRTCRAIYKEAFHLPFVLKEHTIWLTVAARAPPEYNVNNVLQSLWSNLQRNEAQEGVFEIDSLRAFAQMYLLEEGRLSRFLSSNQQLNFRCLTLTIRHADWWHWEADEPLRFEGSWIEDVCAFLPSSVREIHIELESLKRKKAQVDIIAKNMTERWFIKRKDGVTLFPDVSGKSNKISTWTGSSTWRGRRWICDETAPGKIEYYITDIVFRTENSVERHGGMVSDRARQAAENDDFDEDELKLAVPEGMFERVPRNWEFSDRPGQVYSTDLYN